MARHPQHSEGELLDLSKRIGRSPRTLRRWREKGCDLDDPESVKKFLKEKEFLKPPIQRIREQTRLTGGGNFGPKSSISPPARLEPAGNGNVAADGKKGAAAALERLEKEEEQAHRRLQMVLAGGDPLAIEAAQSFWLRCSETLRRLDLAVEVARREAETQVPLRVAQEAVMASSEWTRIAFMQFLSSEARALMGIHDMGEWKAYAIERFKGVLHFTVKNAEKTNSAIPEWALERIKTAWNADPGDLK